jgi:hypothetical protein
VDTNYFEIVVCGPDLAGLVAAALLSRRGMRVLLCGHDRIPQFFSAGPYSLAREPGLLPPPDSESVARVMRELGHTQVIRRRAPALQPSLQFIFPQGRVEFGPDPERVAAELRREFPADHEAIEHMLARLRNTSSILDPLLGSDVSLPPQGFWEKRDVARIHSQLPGVDEDWMAPLPAYHPIRAGLAALGALSGGFSPGDLGGMIQARAYDAGRRGVFRLGSGAELRALFEDKIEGFSGEVREKVVPSELIWRRGRLTGLRVRPRHETIGFGRLIWASSVSSLLTLCGSEASRRLREIAGAIRPACFRYTLCLLVRPEAIPEGMGPRVIAVRDPAKPMLEENALAVTIGAPLPRELQHVPVWVECLVPATAGASVGYLAVVRARVREELSRLLPFFERHLWVLASPHDGLAPEIGIPVGPGEPAPIPPVPMGAALSCDLPRMLGVGGAPSGTGIPNVLVANSENLPGLGREGEFVAAWSAARLIAPDRRQPRRREILIEDT